MLPILIVDDARDDLMLAQAMLRRCRILNPTYLMTTGEECVRFFRNEWKGPEGETPSRCLAFIDLAMPTLNGIQTLAAVSKTMLGQESILVMVSGIQDIKMVRQGYQLGAKTFLIKPLTREEMSGFLSTMNDRLQVEDTPKGSILSWKANGSGLAMAGARETNRIMSANP